MSDEPDVKIAFSCSVDGEGSVQNHFSLLDIWMASEKVRQNNPQMAIDVYFTFLIKTLIDDFGTYLALFTKKEINKEQFEAGVIDNLIKLITVNTYAKKK